MVKPTIQIEDFIKESMKEIEAGLGEKYAIEGPVDFELSVGIVDSTEGGFNLKVLGLGAKRSDDVVQTVNFSIRSKEDPEFKMNNIVMSKLANWLNQPMDKIIQDLDNLNKMSQNKKIISVDDKKLIENSKK
ncbi:hypothetical protein HYX02_01535 [Candidatus Woesearchaeota archaeon]|nr:hypothetical protein [Candidatus Woesearchaeota archaeon]